MKNLIFTLKNIGLLLIVFLFTNSLSAQADGGMVLTADSVSNAYTCPGDGAPDLITFTNTSSSNASYVYVITNASFEILEYAASDMIDFEVAGAGICYVFGISYTGNLNMLVGSDVFMSTHSDDTFDVSANWVTINRASPNGGDVSLDNGDTSINTCAGDENPDVLILENTSNSSANYTYIVTDENNNILFNVFSNDIDFSFANAGTSRIWGLSFTGNYTGMAGDDAAATALSTGCYELSSNFVTVTRTLVFGGTVATINGATEIFLCVGDNNSDEVIFNVEEFEGTAAFTYVITDENNDILAFPAADTVDFETSPPGVCRVWGLSYTGALTAMIGDNAATTMLSDDCYDLSDNFVTVNRVDLPDGGLIGSPLGNNIYACPDDFNFLDLTTTTASSADYVYILTDENDLIFSSVRDSINLAGLPEGTTKIYGLSVGNAPSIIPGENVFDVVYSDCYDLSDNFLSVFVDEPMMEMVNFEGGATEADICIGDGVANPLIIENDATSNSLFASVITDTDFNILGVVQGEVVDLEGAVAGTCYVYGLAYTGSLNTDVIDEMVSSAVLSSDCYDLSENYVIINRTDLDAGTVSTADGMMAIDICLSQDEIVNFTGTSTDANLQYVVTDENNNILGLPDSGEIDFEGAPAGVCRVWILSYTGTITAAVGDNAATTTLTDGCFELSSNFVTVNRTALDGGTVSTTDNQTEVNLCVGNGQADEVSFMGTSTDANLQYVVTDEDNNILDLPAGNMVDFEGAPAGVCRVWILSYTGNITAVVGDNAATTVLTDDCYALSENFVTINRSLLDGGMVMTSDDQTEVNLCVGDGQVDEVSFMGTSMDANLQYVVTDADNNILELPTGNTIDFENSPAGVCRVWILSYTGSITAMVGDNAATTVLTDDCFELSSNFVTINRTGLDGGMVSTVDSETEITLCVGDEETDEVSFMGTSADDNLQYVITDADNNILELPTGNTIDFENSPVGICRVWMLSYTGDIIAAVGDNAGTTVLADDCYALSENFVTVNRVDMGPECIVSTENLTTETFQIQPNPVQDILNVELEIFDLSSTQTTCTIYNIAGQQLISKSIDLSNGMNEFSIDVADFAAGVYWLEVEQDGKRAQRKFVK